MQCPKCQHSKSRVYRTVNHDISLLRYRRCVACGHKWRTWVTEEKDQYEIRSRSVDQAPELQKASGANND